MAAYNSGFVTSIALGDDSLAPFVPVHERPEELIQGGSSNQHYHLTATELGNLQSLQTLVDNVALLDGITAEELLASTKIYEPVIDTELGELMYDDLTGDVMMDFGGEYAA